MYLNVEVVVYNYLNSIILDSYFPKLCLHFNQFILYFVSLFAIEDSM
jgi:hypothetical protein